MSLRNRLRRLQNDRRDCPECYHKPQIVNPYYPGEGEELPTPPACESCGRSLGAVIRVVYEGEGAE